MTAPSQWQQLKRFEQRGDLQKQAEVLKAVLSQHVAPHVIPELLKLAQERASVYAEKKPDPFFSLQHEPPTLYAGSPKEPQQQHCLLPREAKAEPYSHITWSDLGKVDLLVLDIEQAKLKAIAQTPNLSPQQQGLQINKAYAYYPVPLSQNLRSAFGHNFKHAQMPLESVHALPLDLFVSAQHPTLAVADRGAGKVHLIQRDSLRILRTWPIVPAPNKKALSVAFHPDGKRIFVTGNQAGLLVMIDRGIAQKKVPLPKTHAIAQVRVTHRGDICVLAVQPDTRRPDLWILDGKTLKRKQQIALDGEAFSAGADAHDLFEISPDGRYAVVMVSRNQPALFTPCLLLVDLKSESIVDQMVLTPAQKPVNLAFPARQLVHPRFKLLPILRHGGYGITDEQLRTIFAVDDLDA